MCEVTLHAVGDIMLGDSPVCHGFGVASLIYRYGITHPFELVSEDLKTGDINFGNLEVVLSAYDKTRDSFEDIQFRAQPEAVKGLIQANFNILSLATNHTMQHGRGALEETVDTLLKHGINFTGLEIPEKGINNRYLTEIKGLKFCFMGFNLRPQQYFKDAPLWRKPSIELIKSDIRQVREAVDFLVVSLHWGDEFINYPSPQQVVMAHELVDNGVDLILGHHPHILQGIEKYKSGLIAYSLGNFIFDMWQPRLRKSMILKCIFNKSSGIEHQVIPVIINKKHQPEIVSGQPGDRLRQEIDSLTKKISVRGSGPNTYDQELRRNLKRFRREIYWFYLTHIHRYKMKHLIANFVAAMKKRIKK